MAVLDREVLAFDISGVLQAPPEGRHAKRIAGRGRCSEKSHDRHRLLRPRRERPRRRAAEQGYECAPSHKLPSDEANKLPHYWTTRALCIAAKFSGLCRLGVTTRIAVRQAYVSFHQLRTSRSVGQASNPRLAIP